MAMKGKSADDAGGLKDVIDSRESSSFAGNSGIVDRSIGGGQTIRDAYPIDSSTNIGAATSERGGGKFGGGPRDLSHSLGTGGDAAGPTPGRKDMTGS